LKKTEIFFAPSHSGTHFAFSIPNPCKNSDKSGLVMNTLTLRRLSNRVLPLVVLIGLALIFTGCSDEPEPEPVEVLTLTIDPSYDLGLDTWAFMHSADGSLLDHRQITSAGSLTFSGAGLGDDSRVSLTIFNYDTANLNGNIRTTRGLFSYTGLPLHQSFMLAVATPAEAPTPGSAQGNFYVNYQLPAGTTMDILGNGFDLASFWKPSPDMKASNVTLYEKSNDVLLSIVADGNPRYRFFENAAAGTATLSFEDLVEFDKVLTINFPVPSVNPFMQVIAYDADGFNKYYTYNNTYNIAPYTPSTTYSGAKLGSLNKFSTYFVNLHIPQSAYFFTYMKMGTMPDALSLPAQSPFVLNDRTFRDFGYTAELDFTLRTSNFRLKNTPPGDNTYWQITSPPGIDRILELPDDFVTAYPSIIVDNFQHLSSAFEISTDPYLSRVDGVLRGASGRGETFELTVYGSIY
jgi:hypothetical protein